MHQGATEYLGQLPEDQVNQLGLSSTNPKQMSGADYARLVNYARTNHAEVIQDHVQPQPWLLEAMGNPNVLGALGFVSAKLLHHRD